MTYEKVHTLIYFYILANLKIRWSKNPLAVTANMSLEEAKEIIKDIRSIGQTYREAFNAISNVSSVIKPVKRLFNDEKSSLGSRLITAGVALIVFPEPIASDIMGTTLIAAGTLLKWIREPNVADIYRELRKINRSLGSFNREIF